MRLLKRAACLLIVSGAMVCQVVALPNAWAQDPIHKLGRGMVNALTGWLELPKHLNLGLQATNPIIGVGQEILQGVSMTVLRSGLGVYEILTFPIPLPKRFASPYERMELHDYAWE